MDFLRLEGKLFLHTIPTLIRMPQAPEVALRRLLVWQRDPLGQKLMALSSFQAAGTIV